jgi:MerR family mercuric resistance operon transcriptional regulator
MTGLKIGEVAKRGGVNLETIRYYERECLLPKPPRLSSGYRMFPADAVRRIRFIKRAQELGFSLSEIRALLSIQIDAKKECSDVKRLAEAKISDINAKIQTLEAMKRVLEGLTEICPGRGPLSKCPILDSIDSERATT